MGIRNDPVVSIFHFLSKSSGCCCCCFFQVLSARIGFPKSEACFRRPLSPISSTLFLFYQNGRHLWRLFSFPSLLASSLCFVLVYHMFCGSCWVSAALWVQWDTPWRGWPSHRTVWVVLTNLTSSLGHARCGRNRNLGVGLFFFQSIFLSIIFFHTKHENKYHFSLFFCNTKNASVSI